MNNEVSRREMLKAGVAAAGAAAGSHWVFRLTGDGRIVKAQATEAWKPIVLSEREAEQLAAVCEAILPRTDTPGARDARVHEFIDLSLSIENEGMQNRFRENLGWLNDFSKKQTRRELHEASPEQLVEVLTPLSDEHEEHPDDLRTGASFFSDLKSRTIYAYYTSREGWVEELGRPESVGMETWRGCTHGDGGAQL